MPASSGNAPVILVTGADGQIGYELAGALAPLGQIIAATRADADLCRADDIRELVRRTRPNLIVNAAAYTAVDRAESEPALCSAVNAAAPAVLSEEAKRLGAALVHYSTDYVFDGSKPTPYAESDVARPLNVYGCTKLEADQAIADSGVAHIILRVGWVYGLRRTNFLRTIERLARERGELGIVNDQVGSPTWCRSIAMSTVTILEQTLQKDRWDGLHDRGGMFHLSADPTTWYEFAQEIVRHSPRIDQHARPSVRAISSEEFPTAARRPQNSALDSSAIASAFGVRLPAWREQLASALRGDSAVK